MKIFGFLILIGSTAAQNGGVAGLGGWVLQGLNTVQDIVTNNNGSSNSTESSRLNPIMITPDQNDTSPPNDDRIINTTELPTRINTAPQDNNEGFGDRLPQLKFGIGQIRQKWYNPIAHIESIHDDKFLKDTPEVELAKAKHFATIAHNKDLNYYRGHHFDVDYRIIPHEESAGHYHEESEDLSQYKEDGLPEDHYYGDESYFGHHYDSIHEGYGRK